MEAVGARTAVRLGRDYRHADVDKTWMRTLLKENSQIRRYAEKSDKNNHLNNAVIHGSFA